MMSNSRSLSAADSAAVGSSITMSRDLRTSARADVDEPVLGGRQPLDVRAERRRDADAAGDRRRPRARSPRQSTKPKRVFFGRPSMMFSSTVMPGTKRQLLMDEAHAQLRSPDGRRSATNGLPSTRISPRVGLDEAGEDADEGRLARAVGADEAVHLAGQDRERNAFQRLRAAEGLSQTALADDEAGTPAASPCPSRDRSCAAFASTSGRRDDPRGTCRCCPTVTRTAGTSTAFGVQLAPAFTISGRSFIML